MGHVIIINNPSHPAYGKRVFLRNQEDRSAKEKAAKKKAMMELQARHQPKGVFRIFRKSP
jgi:hypothetical protein